MFSPHLFLVSAFMFHIFLRLLGSYFQLQDGEASGKLRALRHGLCDMNLLGHFLGKTLKSEPMGLSSWSGQILRAERPLPPPQRGFQLHGVAGRYLFPGASCHHLLPCPVCWVNSSGPVTALPVGAQEDMVSVCTFSQEFPLHLDRPGPGDPQGHTEVSGGDGAPAVLL